MPKTKFSISVECARADRGNEIERIDVEEPDDDTPPEDVWRAEWDEEDEVVAVLEAVVEHLEVNPWVRDFGVHYNYPENDREHWSLRIQMTQGIADALAVQILTVALKAHSKKVFLQYTKLLNQPFSTEFSEV